MQKNKPSIFSIDLVSKRCATNPTAARIIALFARIVGINEVLLLTIRNKVVAAVE
jgi:hypothetical protein